MSVTSVQMSTNKLSTAVNRGQTSVARFNAPVSPTWAWAPKQSTPLCNQKSNPGNLPVSRSLLGAQGMSALIISDPFKHVSLCHAGSRSSFGSGIRYPTDLVTC